MREIEGCSKHAFLKYLTSEISALLGSILLEEAGALEVLTSVRDSCSTIVLGGSLCSDGVGHAVGSFD